MIKVDDPVYSFNEALRHIDLKKYFVEKEDHKAGRPGYPMADAGYGSCNNKKYRDDPFRAVNFKTDEDGNLVCPNNKKFIFQHTALVKGNQYGRTEDITSEPKGRK